jgi:hypothetical protein
MGSNLELRSFVLSSVNEKSKDFPTTVADLNLWFKFHSLAEITGFSDWTFSIHGIDSHFIINKTVNVNTRNKWNVYKREKQAEIFFSFDCEQGTEFIDDFRQNLMKKLIEDNFDLYSLPSY